MKLWTRTSLSVFVVLFAVLATVFYTVNKGEERNPGGEVSTANQLAIATEPATHITWPDNTYGLIPIESVGWEQWEELVAVVNRGQTGANVGGVGAGMPATFNPDTNRAAFLTTADPETIYATDVPEQYQGAFLLSEKFNQPFSETTDIPPTLQTVNGNQTFGSVRDGRGFLSGLLSNTLFVTIIFPILLVSAVLFFIYRMQRKAYTGGNFTKSKNVGLMSIIPNTTFASVAGINEVVEDLEETVDMLKNRDLYTARGIDIPRGGLLHGPPGTGKTLLARAVAGEAGLPFYYVSGSDMVEMFVGVGAARIREVFTDARKHPDGAIIFIDEIDGFGTKRSLGDNGTSGEQAQTLNALLVELDGFKTSKLFVLGATNRRDRLDPALLRPGRLEKDLLVPYPDKKGRENILLVHMNRQRMDLASNVDVEWLSRRTAGMSGADLQRLVNEAHIAAVRDRRETVTVDDFAHALAYTTMGKERRSAVISEEDRVITAWHEAGHTAIGLLCPHANSPASVSIVPRGQAGGVTYTLGKDNMYLSVEQAKQTLAMNLGGRAAEEKLLGASYTSGPSSDLRNATQLAYAMVTQYGMVDGILTSLPADEPMGQTIARNSQVKESVESLLSDALHTAKTLLDDHEGLLSMIVEELLAKETLHQEDLDAIWGMYQEKLPDDAPG